MTDTRIVYGARCAWWDSINKIGKTAPDLRGHSLPCCPFCGSVLFEMSSMKEWNAGVERYEAAGHPGYGKMITWARGKCFPNMTAMNKAYEESRS